METGKKIVLLGQFGVGKTSLMRRFITNAFSNDYKPTLGVQIKKKVVILPSGKELPMIIWDLEGFSSVSKTRASYLIGSNAFIYVFDITRPITYYNLAEELEFLKTNYTKVLLKVIGNKIDIQDPIDVNTFLQTKSIYVDAFVSAKTGDGVQELFAEIAEKIQ